MDYHRNCELQCISHGLMHITYSETCVNVNDGNARMGQCAVYRLEEHWELYILLLQCFHSSTTGRTVTSAEIDGLAIDA